MIPKIIHYCWFGGAKMPEDAVRCIESWEKYCPDYEIVRWDESNFDLDCNQYVKEAYKDKKWSYVTDVARIKVIYENGGVYLDTDVELIKPLDDLLDNVAYAGVEKVGDHYAINTGLGYGAQKGLADLKEILEAFDAEPFDRDVPAVFHIVGTYMKRNGYKSVNEIQRVGSFVIYPAEYFGAMDLTTRKLHVTKNTYSIHRYLGSWISEKKKKDIATRVKCCKIFGDKLGLRVYGHMSAIRTEGAIRWVKRHLRSDS